MRFASIAVFILVGCGSSTSSPVVVSDTGTDDVGADAPLGETAVDAGPPPHPTPKDLGFEALNPIPAGEQLLFNDWTASPNAFYSIKPDGTGEVEIFRIFRVWAMGVSATVDKVAFSCADPAQKEHFGFDVGDAIQHTWMYDVATQAITPVSKGNLNDECHVFGADAKSVFVCRRYDFRMQEPSPDVGGESYLVNKGWRIAKIDLATLESTFVSPDGPSTAGGAREYHLGPQPTPDGKELWYSITQVTPPNTQKLRIVKAPIAGGTPTTVREDAARPQLSPDGTKYAYSAADTTNKGALFVASTDGSGTPVKITSAAGSEVRWSPDGTRIAYLVHDNANNCSHIDVVKADGSEVAAPFRVRNCASKPGFVTELAWVKK